MRHWLIKKLGGFTDGFRTVDEAIEHIQNTDDIASKHKILTLAVKKLFNTISADDILKQTPDGSWTFEGKPLARVEVNALQAEAKHMAQSRMWKVLEKDMQYLANKTIFMNSKTETDIIAGKLVLFLNKERNERVKKMSEVPTIREAM